MSALQSFSSTRYKWHEWAKKNHPTLTSCEQCGATTYLIRHCPNHDYSRKDGCNILCSHCHGLENFRLRHSTKKPLAPNQRIRFYTNHALVLYLLTAYPKSIRVEDLAIECQVSSRAIMAILNDLEATGYIKRITKGRQNCYTILSRLPNSPLIQLQEYHGTSKQSDILSGLESQKANAKQHSRIMQMAARDKQLREKALY